MSEATTQLIPTLLALPVEERLEVIDALVSSLPSPPSKFEEGTPEFDAMLQRRLEDLESGRVKGVPAEEVLERLRKKYAK
jgi:putative addiction module component (TIGR02574 family)